MSELRHVVWLPTTASWELEPLAEAPCRTGGSRTLHELAVAIASTGRSVEVRGPFESAELQRLGAAAGAFPRQPRAARRPGPGDVLILPEGRLDPLMFAAAAGSGARVILLALAPPGLFGWGFDAGWHHTPSSEVDLSSVGRPEQLRAIRALGFELWTHMPQLVGEAETAGVPCTFIGNGRPRPYPDPPVKRYDVATLLENRWRDDARRVATSLGPGPSRLEIPAGDNAAVIAAIGSARILIHPCRIEGHSRLVQEARAVGTVPVGLSSNRYAVGCDEDHGGVKVASLEAMAGAVRELLATPMRLEELSRLGVETARAQVDWNRYLARVDGALSAPAPPDPGRSARAEIGDQLRCRHVALHRELIAVRGARLAADAARADAERARGSAEAGRAEADRARARADAAREHAEDRLRQVLATRAWRAATVGWRLRARLQRPWRAYSRR